MGGSAEAETLSDLNDGSLFLQMIRFLGPESPGSLQLRRFLVRSERPTMGPPGRGPDGVMISHGTDSESQAT